MLSNRSQNSNKIAQNQSNFANSTSKSNPNMSYIDAIKTGMNNHLIMEFRGGQPMDNSDVIEVNGVKLYHVPEPEKNIDQKATMELNMLLFGKYTDTNEEVIVNGNKLTPHNPIQELTLEMEEESPFKHIQNPTESWGEEDDDFTPPLIRTDSFVYESKCSKTPETPQDPYPVITPPVRKEPEVVSIEEVLDDTEWKIFECPDCKCYQSYTELGYFNHCCSNYHLDNVEQNLLKKINPPITCTLMRSDNLFLDDVEQEYDMWKKSEKNHNKHIEKDTNKTKNICSYCKALKLPFHNTHSYAECPHNKTCVYYPEYMHRFSPLQKIDKNQRIVV